MVVAPLLPNVPSKVISQRISFPSSDEETASYAIGWRIPTPDFKTSVALEVLLRYLHDTGMAIGLIVLAASPFYQAFVEIDNPIASDVDSELKGYLCGAVALHFSGVPFRKGADVEEEDGEEDAMDEGSETGSESSEGMSETENPDGYYFEEGRMHGLVMRVLNETADVEFEKTETLEKMKKTIIRHRRKIFEGLEEDAHDFIAMMLPLDILAYHIAPPEYGKNTKSSGNILF
jgi:hypothetical protein